MRISSDGTARVFWINVTKFLEKKQKKFEFGQTITGVLECNTIRWTEIAFKESKKLKAVGYFEILKNYEEKLHFLDIIFQQCNAPVHKLKIIGDFYQENEWKVLEWPAYSPDLNPIKNSWAILKQRLQRLFWENLEEKLYEIWNEIDAEVVSNVYKNFTNHLQDLKKAKGVTTLY